MTERKDPRHIAIVGGNDETVRRFVESDFKIRSGLCPNGCGLMTEEVDPLCPSTIQRCPACNFTTNVLAEKGQPS